MSDYHTIWIMGDMVSGGTAEGEFMRTNYDVDIIVQSESQALLYTCSLGRRV